MACLVPTACGMTDRRKWVCISSYDCSFMFCRFLTFSDGVLYYEVGSTTCGLTGTYLKTFFMNFNKKILNDAERIFLVIKTDFLYHQNAHFILYGSGTFIFKYTSLFFFFMATKVNRSTKNDFFTSFKKS